MKATIVGCGIGGLVAAWRLLELRADAHITLIDRDTKVGGLLAGGFYGDAATYFDTGTHIPQETGIEPVDRFLQSSVPSEDLILFGVPRGDTSGALFADRFQSNSHFPDLRGHAPLADIADALRRHVKAASTIAPIQRALALDDQLRDRFGAKYADQVLLPRLAVLYGVAAEELCGFALELPGATRVIIDDLEAWLARAGDDEIYRAIIGIPEQTKLPDAYGHGRRSYYSRSRGSSAFVTGAAETLLERGVTFRLGAKIDKIDLVAKKVAFTDASGGVELGYDVLILSAGIMPAAAMLGHDLRSFSFDRPLKHQVLHMLLPQTPTTVCCYACNLDDSGWYRITNYAAFSGDPTDPRLTVEVLGEREEEPETIAAEIRGDLTRRGVLGSAEGDLVGHLVLPSGFPRPSVKNFASLAAVREAVTANLPGNVLLGGVATGKDIFFQNEVITSIHNGMPEFMDRNS